MKLTKLLLITILTLLIISCSEDNSVSPEIEKVWTGLTSQNLPVSITVKNINGTEKIIAYSLQYEYSVSGGNFSGTSSQSNSEGITSVTNNQFSITITEDSSDFLSGTFTSNSLVGDFSVSVIPFSSDTPVLITGTFTAHAQ